MIFLFMVQTPQQATPAPPNSNVVTAGSDQNDDKAFGTHSGGEAPKQRPSVGDGGHATRHLGTAHTVPVKSTPPLPRRKVGAEQPKQNAQRMILFDDTSVDFL